MESYNPSESTGDNDDSWDTGSGDNSWVDWSDEDFPEGWGELPKAQEEEDTVEPATEPETIEEPDEEPEKERLVGLSWQEKAKKQGYYKDDNGWRHTDDEFMDWSESVPGFALDVEYPEIADKTETLAEKFGNDYSDFSGSLKCTIYENINQIQTMSDEQLEAVFALNAFTGNDSQTDRALLSYDEESLENLSGIIGSFNQKTKEQQDKHSGNIKSIASSIIMNYYPEMDEGDFIDTVANCANDTSLIRSSTFSHIIRGFHDSETSGALLGDCVDFLKQLDTEDKRTGKAYSYSDLFRSYVSGHGMTEDTISGFKNSLFPAIESGDEAFDCLRRSRNMFGTEKYSYGIGDYTEECMISRWTPSALDHLKRINGELPTSDFAKFEQNRRDACRIQERIIHGRDFIHDERPGVHAILSAMEQYYDHKDSPDADKYRQRIIELEDKYHYGFAEKALDLEAYDQKVDYIAKHENGAIADANETAIDILRRLVKNTEPDLLEKPKTGNAQLDELLSKIDPLVNKETGEVRVGIKEVGPAISCMNGIIEQNLGKQGVHPSLVSAISYLDKMSAFALRGCDKREIPELAFDPQFKEIVRFAQLTSSTGYSAGEFDNKYSKFMSESGQAYGSDSVNTDQSREALRDLQQWILGNCSDLAKEYDKKNCTRRHKEAVWSGNLNDELISLSGRI